MARVPTFDLGAFCREIKVIILRVGLDLVIGHGCKERKDMLGS